MQYHSYSIAIRDVYTWCYLCYSNIFSLGMRYQVQQYAYLYHVLVSHLLPGIISVYKYLPWYVAKKKIAVVDFLRARLFRSGQVL